MANAKVNTSQFNAMCDQLSKLSAVPPGKVVRAEVGKVIEKTLQYTRSASVSKIRKRYDDFVPMGQDAYSPSRTRRHGTLSGPNLIYYMGNRYSNVLWARLRARRQQLIARKINARGLAKKSWLEIAQMLGITISYPGYVATATPQTGKTYKNVRVTDDVSSKGVSISIVNAQPTANAIGGADALQRAIQGRIRFFNKNVEHAVFAELKKVARAYPGLKIKVAT